MSNVKRFNLPLAHGGGTVVMAEDYDELKLLWDKATQHVLPGEYDTAESIQIYIKDLQSEIQRERAKVKKLRAQRNNLIKRDVLGMALSDMTVEEIYAAYDKELEAVDNEGDK
jgi:hypothetical protein